MVTLASYKLGTKQAMNIRTGFLRTGFLAGLFLMALVVPLAQPAWAEQPDRHHAIAMHGTPKYPADYTHLDYANPDAPKGGTLRHGVTGTFDNLHVNTIKGQPAAGLGMIYDQLMARVWDEPFTMYGLVASHVDMPADRSEITFHLL